MSDRGNLAAGNAGQHPLILHAAELGLMEPTAHMSNLDLALSVALGIGLAAATGFRLFLPLLILSGAAYTGHASLNEGFAWLGTPAAVIMLGTAAIVEIAAFYIPGVDNLLDTVATPGAVVAGDDRVRRCHDRPAADGEMDGGHYRREVALPASPRV